MGTGTKILLAILGIALVVALLSANLVVAADRTVLDGDFVKDTANEEEVYEVLVDEIREELEQEAPDGDADELPIDRSPPELIQAAIDEETIREQGDENIDALYAYLHGETDELHLEIDLGPIVQDVTAELEAELSNIDLGEVGVPQGEEMEAMAESEEQFEQHQAEFKEEQKERIQEETPMELSDEELEQAFEEQSDELRDELLEQQDQLFEQELSEEMDVDADIEEPAEALLTAHVDALLGEIKHDEYEAEVESAKDDLAAELVDVLEDELEEELPDDGTVELTEELDDEAMEPLEMAQDVVSAVGLLAIALPLVALLIAGVIAWLAPPSTASLTVGTVSTLVGAVGIGVAQVAGGQVESLIAEGDAPDVVADFVLGIVSGVLGTITVQSAILLVVGLGLIGVGIAIRQGVILEDRY